MQVILRILCLFYLLLSRGTASAQEEDIGLVVEDLTETLPVEQDFSELTEKLSFYRKHPINLNKATPESLKSLYFLSALQISNFFSYLQKSKLMDVLELQAIPGFDPATINRLLPFVVVRDPIEYTGLKPKNLLNGGSHELTFRYSRLLQQQKGYKNLKGSGYLGTADKLITKYKYNYQQVISAGFLLEKDAGEKLFNRKTGVDHVSAHLALFKLGIVKKLVIGDYSMQFGQGLTLWSGFSFGKGPDVTSVAAKDVGLKPYSSTNESMFFRGAAITLNMLKNIDVTAFASSRRSDASLTMQADGNLALSNINSSGLHRTPTEVQNQRSVTQQAYGAVLQYLSDNLNLGFIAYRTIFQHQFFKGAQLYNKYAFSGRQLGNIGIHYNYNFKSVYLYGEIAQSTGAGSAILAGAMTSLSPKISAVVLHRSYDKNYHNFFSAALGEGSETNNEKGWYLGLNYYLTRQLTWSVYGDYFRFPWMKYRVSAASSGYEFLHQLNYSKSKKFKAALRFKFEQKQQNPDEGSDEDYLEKVVKQNYRLEWTWKLDAKFNFHQRLESSRYQKGKLPVETGLMLYQDVSYTPIGSKISGNVRFAWFNTGSYNSRIYAYEADVLHGSGSGLYSGKGVRAYLNARYKIATKIDMWVRLATSIYPGQDAIGTGLDQIEGNKKTELKVQLSYRIR